MDGQFADTTVSPVSAHQRLDIASVVRALNYVGTLWNQYSPSPGDTDGEASHPGPPGEEGSISDSNIGDTLRGA